MMSELHSSFHENMTRNIEKNIKQDLDMHYFMEFIDTDDESRLLQFCTCESSVNGEPLWPYFKKCYTKLKIYVGSFNPRFHK